MTTLFKFVTPALLSLLFSLTLACGADNQGVTTEIISAPEKVIGLEFAEKGTRADGWRLSKRLRPDSIPAEADAVQLAAAYQSATTFHRQRPPLETLHK